MSDKFIFWNEKFSVGAHILDDQHKQIIDVINTIYEIQSGKSVTGDLANSLLRLQFFTESHFQYEEIVMKFANYPQLSEHRLLHQEMTARTTKICSQLRSSIQTDTDELFHLLKDWWLTHICKEDHLYSEYVKKLNL